MTCDGVLPPPAHLPPCPPVSRLGHYPEAGAHFVTTGVQGHTMPQTLIHQDCLGAVFTLDCPRVQISSTQIWFRDWESFRQMQLSTSREDWSSVMLKWFCIPGCLSCVTADFYGNWTSHPSHIRIHFWVITQAHQASCFEVATKQETELLNSHEKIKYNIFFFLSSLHRLQDRFNEDNWVIIWVRSGHH